jgi:hypothetical protein
VPSEAEDLGYIHRWNPDLWALDVLGFRADPVQAEFLNCEDSDIIVNCTRQWGKTTTSGIKAAHKARFVPESEILIVSATQRQAGILEAKAQWALLKASQKFQPVRGKEYDVMEYDPEDGPKIVRRSVLSLELSNGSRIISTPASEDSIRGYSPSTIMADEDSRILDSLYDALRPMRAAHPCQLILMSTPNGKRGHFYREWTSDDPVWHRFQVTAYDCPRITKAFLDRERTKMTSEAMFSQEYFCEFIDLEGAVLGQQVIQDMFSDSVLPIAFKTGQTILGDVRGIG